MHTEQATVGVDWQAGQTGRRVFHGLVPLATPHTVQRMTGGA
ncbi:MAG: hypothetical protein ACRD1K_13900 [Acidimicrobiales bacterium]